MLKVRSHIVPELSHKREISSFLSLIVSSENVDTVTAFLDILDDIAIVSQSSDDGAMCCNPQVHYLWQWDKWSRLEKLKNSILL